MQRVGANCTQDGLCRQLAQKATAQHDTQRMVFQSARASSAQVHAMIAANTPSTAAQGVLLSRTAFSSLIRTAVAVATLSGGARAADWILHQQMTMIMHQ